jgi:hypothetical protein
MSSWAKTDSGNSAPLWALLYVNKSPTAANMSSSGNPGSGKLYRNETASAFISGATIGLFNINASETSAGQLSQDGSTLLSVKGAHRGWVLRKTGSGGRASRTQSETLVCLTSN